jgi:co-chaperonin GroES (HSP10)
MTLQAIQDCVIIAADPALAKWGTLIIPEAYRPTLWSGKVIAVGPKVRDLKIGQHVLCNTAQAVQHEYQGEELLFTREPDVIAVLGGKQAIPLQKPLTRREWEGTIKEQTA